MGLAGEHELQAAIPLRQAAQPVGVVKQQVRTLVRRGPAGKAQREDVVIEARIHAAIHLFDQALFRFLVGLPNRL